MVICPRDKNHQGRINLILSLCDRRYYFSFAPHRWPLVYYVNRKKIFSLTLLCWKEKKKKPTIEFNVNSQYSYGYHC